jgi:hypothetical protein
MAMIDYANRSGIGNPVGESQAKRLVGADLTAHLCSLSSDFSFSAFQFSAFSLLL